MANRPIHEAYVTHVDKSFLLTNGVVKTLEFKDAAGNLVKAEKLHIRADGISIEKIHHTIDGSVPTTANFWINVGEAILTVESFTDTVKFLHNAAGTTIYVRAYGYRVMSGTTVT